MEERKRAVEELKNNFALLEDKKYAWEDLIKLTSDTDSDVRRGAAHALVRSFSQTHNKKYVWEDLHRLTSDNDSYVRRGAALALGNTFLHVPDKKLALEDFHRLTFDTNSYVRFCVATALGSAFSYVLDKKQAWEDLIRLTSDTDSEVPWRAASALMSVFSQVPDKKQAWYDLHRLTSDTDSDVRWVAACVLMNVFSQVPDKKQAWNDLINLAQDGEINVGWGATDPLGSVFAYVYDKKQAQDDLHQIIQDEGNFGRFEAALALGGAFAYVPDKDQAWNDLQRLTHDEDSDVKTYANYSLGKASIFKAANSENDDDRKKEMEAAIGYFEKTIKQSFWSEPAKFCLPFYRSFYTLTFTKEETGAEVQKYITEAKSAIEGSESKEKLLEVIKYLDLALRKAQKPKNLNEFENNINDCGRYFEYADNLLVTTEKKAPLTTKLIRVGMQNINDIFRPDLKNLNIPRIQTVHISDTQNEIVRIAVIQFCYKLTKSFPLALENKEECKHKIISALDNAKSDGANIACLPELCMFEEWVQDIKSRYPDMIIIGGSYYKNDFNECPVIMNIEVPPQLKKFPSRPEDPEITGRGMKSGDKLYRYETQFGTFSVLVCIDFLNYAKFCDHTDIIFCPSYSDAKGIERFHEYANSHVTNIPSYIIISNTALFGGTSIFGQLHRDYYRGLVENGCKRSDIDSYKLCDLEKGFEGIIIADFDLVHKSPQVPTPVDSNKVIKSIKSIRKFKIS